MFHQFVRKQFEITYLLQWTATRKEDMTFPMTLKLTFQLNPSLHLVTQKHEKSLKSRIILLLSIKLGCEVS